MYVGGAGPTVAKGLKGLMNSLEGGDKGVWLEHYEQLEFLGDAVLEYITRYVISCPHGNRIAGSIIVHELTIFVIFEDS